MSIANLLFPQGNFLDIRANAPNQRSYNIDATRDLVENNPLGLAGEIYAPVTSFFASPFYDAIQASQRMEPGSGIAGFAKAFDAENPISSAFERAYGATLPLAERLSNIFSMGTAEASDLGAIASNEMLQSILNPKTPKLGESYFDRTNRTSPIVEDDPYPPEFFPNDQQDSLKVDMGATGTIPTLNNTGIMNIDVPFGTPIDIAQGFTKNTPSDQGTNFQFLPSANEDETDVVEEKKRGGIGDLFRALLGFAIPGASFFFNKGRDALGGIRSLNQRLRNTDFAKSKTLADYLDARKYGGRQERDDAAARNMAQARSIQKKIDRGEFGTRDRSIDRGRGSIPSRSSPTRSKRDTSPSSSYSQASYARRR